MHIVSTQKRPRVLDWFHAGPLLFGDWGTSRLYVLGLAFYYTGHASVLYLGAMSLIMCAVAWAYTIVCRSFPEGGVYTAARQLSPTLAVVGATLLLCDYIVTAALSAVEAFHYLRIPHTLTVLCCLITIIGIGIINWLGARSAGRLALFIAVGAIVASLLIGILCIPMLKQGLSTISLTGDHAGPGASGWLHRWESLVRIVLALSGVEAVANMTGLMREPVPRTSRRTIWPVLVEVILLNMIFGIALNALPQLKDVGQPAHQAYEVIQGLPSDQVPMAVQAYRDTAVRLLAEHSAGEWFGERFGYYFGITAAIIFSLLLLSAVNTAVMAMVSVMYSMGHDGEMPRGLTKLNYSGVPWLGLIIACVLPLAVLAFEADAKALGELYAIGVVGAITINFFCCAANRALTMDAWERRALWALAGLMALIELTIMVRKPHATLFAGGMLAAVLTTRFLIKSAAKRRAIPAATPTEGWLTELQRTPLPIVPGQSRMMLAARGRGLAEFAVDHAHKSGSALFAIYVRTLRVMDVAPGAIPKVEDDPEAIEALGTVASLARRSGIPFVPIYVCSSQIAEEILDYTVTFACSTLIMGKSHRAALARVVQGDVVAQVMQHLPREVNLIARESGPSEYHRVPEPPAGVAGTGA